MGEMHDKIKSGCNKAIPGDNPLLGDCPEKETCPFWVAIEEDSYYSFCGLILFKQQLERYQKELP